jgi:hypothetical protein
MKISLKLVVSYTTLEPLLEPRFMYFDHGIFHFCLAKVWPYASMVPFCIKQVSRMNT